MHETRRFGPLYHTSGNGGCRFVWQGEHLLGEVACRLQVSFGDAVLVGATFFQYLAAQWLQLVALIAT